MIVISTKRALSVSSIVARSLIGGLAGLAISWALYVIPIFWRQLPIENIAGQIIAEDTFKAESLTSIEATYSELKRFEGGRPSVLSAVAVITLRQLEQAVARGQKNNLDIQILKTNELVRQSLSNTPANPFLWTVLFWLENTRDGFSSLRLSYLRMSYSTGPNEGWVAVKRNRFALAIYSSLAPDLTNAAITEFCRLVDSNFLDAAADILEGPGWPIREILMSHLKAVDEFSRQSFAKLIYRRGVDLVIPGVDQPEWRPWH